MAAPAARTAAWAASFVTLAFSVGLSVLPPAMIVIAPELKLTTPMLSALSAAMFAPFLLMVAAGAYLLRWFAKGAIATAGALALGVGSAIVGASDSYPTLVAGVAVLGVGAGTVECSVPALINSLYEGRKRTAAMNYSQVAYAAGAIGVPAALAALISAQLDWRIGFWGAGAIAVASAGWMAASRAVFSGPPQPGRSAKGGIPDGFTAVLSFAMFLYVAAEVAFCYWLPLYFKNELQAADSYSAISNGLFWTGAMLGRLGAGWMGHKLGERPMLLVSSAGATGVLALFMLCRTPAAAMVVVLVTGLAFAAIWPTLLSYAGSVYGSEIGASFSWMVGSGAVGATAGPLLLGWLASATSSRAAFVINPAFLAIIAVIVVIAPRLERFAGKVR